MNTFLKWTFRAFLSLFAIGIVTAIGSRPGNIHVLDGLLSIIIGSLILGVFFYFIEIKWISMRRIKLMRRISKIFGSRAVAENITHFKLGMFDIYAELKNELSVWQHQNAEVVTFYIPRSQLGLFITNKGSKFKESECNGILTYTIHQTNSWGLNTAKKRIEKMLS